MPFSPRSPILAASLTGVGQCVKRERAAGSFAPGNGGHFSVARAADGVL